MKNSGSEKRKHERLPVTSDAVLSIIGALAHRECPMPAECQQAKVVERDKERIVISTSCRIKTGDFIKMNNGISDKPASGVVMWVLAHESTYQAEVLIL